MFDGILRAIQSKSREQWEQATSQKAAELREYVRANGEKAALIGFLLGVFIVIFYKLALIVGCLAAIGYQLVLIVSDSRKAE
jgi:hypothetical protein